jgi:RNA polymerase sigma-70 factor (ECF subfamily)
MKSTTGETDERALVRRSLGGEDDAFASLVRTHQSAVFNIAYRLAGDREVARELAQETFLRAYRALDTFDLNRSFAPWLYRIATNLSINWIKRARVPTIPLDAPASNDKAGSERIQIPDSSSEPAAQFMQAEMQAQLRQEIVSLPPDYRAVIELRHYQELSYEEMAETLNLPLGTVKTRLYRARRLLRDRLALSWDRWSARGKKDIA